MGLLWSIIVLIVVVIVIIILLKFLFAVLLVSPLAFEYSTDMIIAGGISSSITGHTPQLITTV